MIINTEKATHYKWGENCDAWTFFQNKNAVIKLEMMPAGTREQLHKHEQSEQFFFIQNGEATFYIHGKKSVLKAQEGIFIPKHTPHYIANEYHTILNFLVFTFPFVNGDRINL